MKAKQSSENANGRPGRVIDAQIKLTAIGLEANFDEQTQLAYKYREENVYQLFQRLGMAVQVIAGAGDKRSSVASAAKKSNVDYLTGCGHGLFDTYAGYWDIPIFEAGSYDSDEAKGKIVHFLSCRVARDLGPDFVHNGCLAFFSYREDFFFHPNDADIFFECDSQIDLAFAAGLTAGEVYTKTVAVFDKYIQQYRDNGQFCKAATLQFDRDYLCAPSKGPEWGSVHARLT
jgi:hypothetical protein